MDKETMEFIQLTFDYDDGSDGTPDSTEVVDE